MVREWHDSRINNSGTNIVYYYLYYKLVAFSGHFRILRDYRYLCFAAYGLLFVQCIMLLSRQTLIAKASRIWVTLLTACQLNVGQHVQIWPLNNPIVVYIGDMSYVLYLVHWPVILYVRYWSLHYDLSMNGKYT